MAHPGGGQVRPRDALPRQVLTTRQHSSTVTRSRSAGRIPSVTPGTSRGGVAKLSVPRPTFPDMRLLHTSDWPLGRSLHRADLHDAQAAFLDHLVEAGRAER